VRTRELDGDGVIEASGGDGYVSDNAEGGGGSGGRIAVYYVENYFIGTRSIAKFSLIILLTSIIFSKCNIIKHVRLKYNMKNMMATSNEGKPKHCLLFQDVDVPRGSVEV